MTASWLQEFIQGPRRAAPDIMGSHVWKEFLSLRRNPASNVFPVKLLNWKQCIYVALGHEKCHHLIQWVIVLCLKTHLFELAGR